MRFSLFFRSLEPHNTSKADAAKIEERLKSVVVELERATLELKEQVEVMKES